MVAFPYLYKDPLRLIGWLAPNKTTRHRRVRALLRTLLLDGNNSNGAAAQHRPPLHRALVLELDADTLDSSNTTASDHTTSLSNIDDATVLANTDTALLAIAPIPPQRNFLRHIRHIYLTGSSFMRRSINWHSSWDERDYSADQLQYIHSPEFWSIYPLSTMETYCYKHTYPKKAAPLFYPILVDREAIWALATPIFEQLESLTIPLSDIRRYVEVVDRLGNLGRIHIFVDLVFECYSCGYGHYGSREKPCKVEAIKDVEQLVKSHVQRFPGGRLKDVTSSQPRPEYVEGQSVPADFNSAHIFRILPPPSKPILISQINWARIAFHHQTTDLSRVRAVHHFPQGANQQELLQQCRSLKKLSVPFLLVGSFDWAVQEKRDLESTLGRGIVIGRTLAPDIATTTNISNSNSNSNYNNNSRIHHDQEVESSSLPPLPAYRTHGLVPLESVTLQACTLPCNDLDAIAYAFSQTLKDLRIETLLGSNQVSMIYLGQGWVELPVLDRLELYAPRNRLVLDSVLFLKCPSLRLADIFDQTSSYSCTEIIPCLPANLPEITSLYLRGWPALTFHPASFESMKNLMFLKLTMKRTEYCFIPPIEELRRSYGLECDSDGKEDRNDDADGVVDGSDEFREATPRIIRPQWTWDWDLPHLSELQLTSEFAYLFEFRMLHGCPSLEILRLHMRTEHGHHTRVITESDLFVSGADGLQERIVAPSLRKLYMNGHWVIEDPMVVLPQFLGLMFPKLYRLVARGWCGVGVSAFVKAIRTTAAHVWLMKTDLKDPSKEEGDELGLYRRSKEFRKDHRALKTRLFCLDKEYILRKQ
ncbi:hypothetical protein BG015_000633 [Linnemannia schmuckeri]|uniref:Uncharacterized protein n=1 Tax=Linnemannia schmuckeri TaxID=64567 RepID=A0A9P5S4C0_9FUNG|nr:hypothetical protein BG015_000633 [Linnemannia schmuckeri]